LIVGGGLAGGRAVNALRERDPEGSITLVGEEEHVPYYRPPLSKGFLRGEKDREKIRLAGEEHYRDAKVDLILGKRVESLDPDAKEVTLEDGETLRFEKALLATGGTPVRPPIPGIDLPNVFVLRNLEDAEAIREAAQPGTEAVIVGAGFIGMELASSLTQMGVDVTVVEMMPQLWPRFAGEDLALYFEGLFEERGVAVRVGQKVTEIRGEPRGLVVETEEGLELPADFVIVAAGIRPNVELAEEAGLEVEDGVVVDAQLRTSHPDVYAAGDIANYPDPHFDKRRRVEHWGQADYTGTLAGHNMAGAGEEYDLLTYVWSDIFDRHLEFAGDPTGKEQVLQRGELGDETFVIFYLRDGRMRAYFAVNADEEDLANWQKLIEQRRDLSGMEWQLRDVEFPPMHL
jgi:NADPH-dependent 2,4-dienoyl-CoA reductase/sulfur reductase-like enzyme